MVNIAKNSNETSLKSAALIAGLSLLVMVIFAPYAEMYVFPKLIVRFQPTETAKNIIENKPLFISGIFAYLITLIGDLVLTWALYILLKPVRKNLSLLTAWFRLVYTVIALVALNNVITSFRMLTTPDYLNFMTQDQVNINAMIYLSVFKNHWYFGMIFFAVHLLLLGFLVIKSVYIPRILGILLIITGIGYLLTSLRPYLFPAINIDFAMFTFFGEIVFMLWLLIRGHKITEVH
ncbi:MAG: DUF4386 domain-containing protein [Chitinophagaceae bacterium]|nr:DUF4386 domain-containing protein [Chitinophagaceae bacterium]